MVIAGTGHRPQGLTTNPNARYTNQLINALSDFYSLRLQQLQPTKVIGGGALGADTGLAVAALKLGIPLTLALPFYGHDRKWGKQAQELHRKIEARAAEVIYVEQGGYEPWKMQARNEWMVDECDLLLTLWSGAPGGTANCVRYARSVGKPMLYLWSEWVQYRHQVGL